MSRRTYETIELANKDLYGSPFRFLLCTKLGHPNCYKCVGQGRKQNYGVRVPVSFGMPILNVCAVPFNQVGYHTSHRQQKKRHLIIVSAI